MLARHYNILIEDILNANPGVDPYNLQIGQQVCIPTHRALPSETRPECSGIIHTVRPGDTLYMLAKQYKTTLDEIIDANPNIDCHMLQIGMELCIPVTSGQRGLPLQTPDQAIPSIPFMPVIPEFPAPEMPAMPSVPTPSVPSMPGSIPTLPTIPVPDDTQSCKGFMYTIRAGDTLYMLSRTYHVNLDTLMRANPNMDPYNLRIGMHICIPVTDRSQTKQASDPVENDEKSHSTGRIYKTQQGDTLTKILDRYEITFAALKNSNPDVNFTEDLENMSLNIPSEDLFHTCKMSDAYIVKSGDSLDSISKKLLVLTDSLLMANPVLTIDDFSIPDTKVCIPNQ